MCTKEVFGRARAVLSNSLSPLRLRIYSRPRRFRTGKMEVDGSDPPFLLPGAGAGALRNSHLRNTPWGGRSRPNSPCGKTPAKISENLLWSSGASVPPTWCGAT